MDAGMSPEVHRRTMPRHQHATVTVPGPSDGFGVHADLERMVTASAGIEPVTQTVSVVTDATSGSLARIFVLLATLSLIPVATSSASSEQHCICLRLSFAKVDEVRIDLLCRKLLQLTETISVDASEPRQH